MFNTIVEMSKDLIAMDTNTYNEAKHTLQAWAKNEPNRERFIMSLFAFTDSKRPLLIEMKGSAAV